MSPVLALLVAAVPAFVASIVEFVEAFTIVLAVGNTRGWRAPLWGTLGAVATLAVLVAFFGTPLVLYRAQIEEVFYLAVGTLLALAAVGAWTALAGDDAARRNLGGPLLFVLLMALLLGNLYATGRAAASRWQPD